MSLKRIGLFIIGAIASLLFFWASGSPFERSMTSAFSMFLGFVFSFWLAICPYVKD